MKIFDQFPLKAKTYVGASVVCLLGLNCSTCIHRLKLPEIIYSGVGQ